MISLKSLDKNMFESVIPLDVDKMHVESLDKNILVESRISYDHGSRVSVKSQIQILGSTHMSVYVK